jgi:uncharacterized cupredoxin-like copper-binding protein
MNPRFSCLVIAAALGLIGCDDETEEVVTPAPSEGATVNVEVGSFFVRPSPTSVHQGEVRFVVSNVGTVVHEFLVVRTALAADALPVNPNGTFNEEGEGVDVLDEIEDIDPGSTREITLTLDISHYALLCNLLVTDANGNTMAHYSEGMHADFEVTDGITQ